MDASSAPPKQELDVSNRHIPQEIIKEILLNLPVKSLVRFLCVSKSWKSMIFESWFIRKHFSRATLLQKRLFVTDYPFYPFDLDIRSAFSCALSSISNQNETDSVSPFIRSDINLEALYKLELKAICEELWCVATDGCLYLCNPTTGTHRKLGDPPRAVSSSSCIGSFANYVEAIYGLCYDRVNDDYKLLKVWRANRSKPGTLLYSLRSDSWREIHHDFPGISFPHSNGGFLNGAFHWMVVEVDHGVGYGGEFADLSSTIISFDLSTETYKEVPQPMYSPPLNSMDYVEVTILKGMLCVFLNYRDTEFVMWVMNDYGVKESWMIMLNIRFDSIPYILQESWRIDLDVQFRTGKLITLMPMYLYEDGGVLIWMCTGDGYWETFIHKYGEIVAHQRVVASERKRIPMNPFRRRRSMVHAGFVHVESLISPATYGPQLEASTKHRL